jgi:hypothetical protein
MNGKLFQHIHPIHAFPAAVVAACEDFFDGDPASDVIALKKYGAALFLIVKNMKTATASGFATTAGADQMYAIEIHADALSTTDAFVRLQTTELVDSPVDGMMTAIAGDARYLCEVKPTALA